MAHRNLDFWWIAFLVFIIDRLSKFLVIKEIPLGSSVDFSLFSITHIFNTGTAFGLLKGASWFFVIFSVVVSAYLVYYYSSYTIGMQRIFGLILGGALGNLVDRLYYGAVVDFIDVHFWPVFNMADSAISVSIFLLLFYELGFFNVSKKTTKRKV